jgi:hypothetical protein
MWWLRSRLHRRRRNQRPEQPTGEQPVPETPARKPPEPDPGRPRLVLLVRDAAGPASYQLHSFEDESEAASFVQFWFPGDFDHGVIAFWASHREPEVRAGERPAEVVVLVRDETRSKTVCPFSFAGMDLAQSWVARESDRGLDLHPDHVLIFWAVPARISRDHWGRVHLWPSEPPDPRPNGRRATLTQATFLRKPASAPPPPAPPAEMRAPVHEQAPFEQRLELPAELLAAMEIEEAEQAADAPAPAPPTEEPMPAREEAHFEQRLELPAELLASPEVGEAEQAVDLRALELPVDEAVEVETSAVEDAAEVEPPAVNETPRVDEKPTAFKKTGPRKENKPFDAGKEIEELHRRSGWEKREGPFRGFGSPPGKF